MRLSHKNKENKNIENKLGGSNIAKYQLHQKYMGKIKYRNKSQGHFIIESK